MHHIDFDLNVIEPGKTEGRMDMQPFHQQQSGFLHGGVIATVADTVAGFAAFSLVKEDQHVVTAELKISYFHPGVGEQLRAVGTVIKQGKKMNFCEAEVYCSKKGGEETLIAKASATMATIFPEDIKK